MGNAGTAGIENTEQEYTPIILDDTMVVAYLKLKGYTVNPFVTKENLRDHRVSFRIDGEKEAVEAQILKYYENEQVGVEDYTRCLKDVKSAMYNMRRIGR